MSRMSELLMVETLGIKRKRGKQERMKKCRQLDKILFVGVPSLLFSSVSAPRVIFLEACLFFHILHAMQNDGIFNS